jgi:hypothetical protein
VHVIFDSPFDLADFIESESSVENGLEVAGIKLDSAIIVLDGLAEILLLTSLPPVGVQNVGLLQRVLSTDVLLQEAGVVERTILASPN